MSSHNFQIIYNCDIVNLTGKTIRTTNSDGFPEEYPPDKGASLALRSRYGAYYVITPELYRRVIGYRADISDLLEAIPDDKGDRVVLRKYSNPHSVVRPKTRDEKMLRILRAAEEAGRREW